MSMPSSDTGVWRYLYCSVGDQTYCLQMSRIAGIEAAEAMHSDSRAAPAIGWLGGRQENIPVFSVAQCFTPGIDRGDLNGKVIVIDARPRPWGLLVDRVEHVIEVTADEIFDIPATARDLASNFFEHVIKHNGQMILALAPEGLHPDRAAEPAPYTAPVAAGGRSWDDLPPARVSAGKLVCFSTSEQLRGDRTIAFGLSMSQVPEILQTGSILPMPGAAPAVLGLIEWREAPVTVLDLSQRLGGPASVMAQDGRLVIARASMTPELIGFPVLPQIRIRSLPLAHRIRSDPVPLQESLLRGVFDLAREILVVPDIDGVCRAGVE